MRRQRTPSEPRRQPKKAPGDENGGRLSTISPRFLETGNATLRQAATALEQRASPCRLCPHECGVDRARGERGKCRLARETIVASASLHFGEERPISGTRGSGTIFFSSCNLACVFCQNSDISHSLRGESVSGRELASLMLRLQTLGCHNINLVTPTHVIHAIVGALAIAAPSGLRVPLVYNCGGFESVETLRLLDGIVDIYMPDLKYSSNEKALRYSGARDYWDRARGALKEMHRQVGDLVLNERGIAVSGLLVRHLVMPGGIAGSERALEFISQEISRDTWVNVMEQYRPCDGADRMPELARPITRTECRQAVDLARRAGLTRGLPV
jgi:putative pyruvate formate lyase activating enzyme